MNTEFYAKGTAIVETPEPRAVIYGDVLCGEIREGMYVHISINRAFSVTVQIESIEFTDGNEADKGHLILILKPEDIDDAEMEAEFIQILGIQNELLIITAST
jgi:hypothetical protein